MDLSTEKENMASGLERVASVANRNLPSGSTPIAKNPTLGTNGEALRVATLLFAAIEPADIPPVGEPYNTPPSAESARVPSVPGAANVDMVGVLRAPVSGSIRQVATPAPGTVNNTPETNNRLPEGSMAMFNGSVMGKDVDAV